MLFLGTETMHPPKFNFVGNRSVEFVGFLHYSQILQVGDKHQLSREWKTALSSFRKAPSASSQWSKTVRRGFTELQK